MVKDCWEEDWDCDGMGCIWGCAGGGSLGMAAWLKDAAAAEDGRRGGTPAAAPTRDTEAAG